MKNHEAFLNYLKWYVVYDNKVDHHSTEDYFEFTTDTETISVDATNLQEFKNMGYELVHVVHESERKIRYVFKI